MMTREMGPAFSRFWTDDRGLPIFLAALVAIIVVPALGPVGLPGRFLGDALVSLVLVSGAAAVADRSRTMLTVSVITVPALLVRWTSWLFPTADLAVWREISTLATLVVLWRVVLGLVLRRGPITARRIEGRSPSTCCLASFGRKRTSWWHSGIRERSREQSTAAARCRGRTTAS
jgi:hypothetical protein